MTERELLEALTVDDPWCRSQEGLDDGCHFCGSWAENWKAGRETVYLHEPTCAWIGAMDYLGRTHPNHAVKERGEL